MKFITQMERYERILLLIKRKATGTPNEFAERIGVSESTLYEYLRVLKERGAEIEYCDCRISYILKNDFNIVFGCTSVDIKEIKGGRTLFSSLQKNKSEAFYTCSAFN
ncbi:MAG: HTH domain-containing protein [Carboxylicivirga sp.]|jgi:DNA-binding transcriptional ArsR family regulator|nr:HTH domain-containing protein [Carboxylicivirga sp.]